MDFRTRLKAHLHAHSHAGAGMLVGITAVLFMCSLRFSVERIPSPQNQATVSMSPLVLRNNLRNAAAESLPESLPASVLPAASSIRSSAVPDHADAPVPSSVDVFPPFIRTVNIVSKVPNWGAMRSPEEWNRTYDEMTDADFVALPAYDMTKLAVPMKELTNPISAETIPEITRKLVYSTRYFAAYDLDADEFTAIHPGIDIKLARGTPVGAIAGGRVNSVSTTKALGLHVIIEHRIGGATYYSIYGHFDTASVSPGQAVEPGQIIGTVGMTGNTSAPHVHLQIDRGAAGERYHEPYLPSEQPSPRGASRFGVHPVSFIAAHAGGTEPEELQ